MTTKKAQLSKAGQMRLKRAQGMSVGDIGRLFGVSYHNAYATVVTYAGRDSRVEQPKESSTSKVSIRNMEPEELAAVSTEALLRVANGSAKTRFEKQDRYAATNELDRRIPDGSWMKL